MAQKESPMSRVNAAVSRLTHGEIWDVREPVKVISQALLGVVGAVGVGSLVVWTVAPDTLKSQVLELFTR